MKANIKIIGIGVICSIGNEADLVWERLDNKEKVEKITGKIPYYLNIPINKKRKLNRYATMCIYASKKAIEDSNINIQEIDPYIVGTIFTTGYGPSNSKLSFAEMVAGEKPEDRRPMIFVNSTYNSCLGHVCEWLNLKGVSTSLMGSNNLGYSQIMMEKGCAEYILSGAVEEYNSYLYQAIEEEWKIEKNQLCEAEITFLLSRSTEFDKLENYYCNLVDFEECNIGGYPLSDVLDEESVMRKIKKALKKIILKYGDEIDAIFCSDDSYIGKIEDMVIRQLFNGKIPYKVHSVKEYLGETMGAAFNMNIMIAALSLKNKRLPYKISQGNIRTVRNVLVTGYDVSGNYIVYFLRRSK